MIFSLPRINLETAAKNAQALILTGLSSQRGSIEKFLLNVRQIAIHVEDCQANFGFFRKNLWSLSPILVALLSGFCTTLNSAPAPVALVNPASEGSGGTFANSRLR
jgi:hypothetical protein